MSSSECHTEDDVIARYVRELGPPPKSTVLRVAALIGAHQPKYRDQSPTSRKEI